MRLPNADLAYVPPRKLTDYLLSETHAVGKAKAKFFRKMGFKAQRIEVLRQALLEIAQTGEVKEVIETPCGKKYIVDGVLHTPSGRQARIRTVWIVETGQESPRFVTAYPWEGG
ncbi:MAG TPA: hypothetical protein ENK56_09520 [Chloroflexi bacterium]|nr:hypothetical protein [Chloroflexota bacterium]